MLEHWKNKKILILGLGKEGLDAFFFLRKIFPKKVIGVGDKEKIKNQKLNIKNIIKKDRKVKWHLGENYLKAIKDYDVIIKSPGVPIHLPEVEMAYKRGKIVSPTQIFFENCPGKIVGVTGTKGKSTTTVLIYKILKEELKVHPVKFASQTFNRVNLVGNIGKPALSLLLRAKPGDVYVYELSCHQLYQLKKSPQVAVFLNIYPEHLDYYKDFNEYFGSKSNITKHQSRQNYLIFNPKDKNLRKIRTRAKRTPIALKTIKKFIKNKDIPLKGDFNLMNVSAAIEVGKIFGVSEKKIAEAVKNFKPLPHRLEYVGDFKGIKFYDDALSTIQETAIAALDALGKNVQTIILGGYERNLDFTKLAQRILKSGIKNVILFPTTGKRIWESIRQAQDKSLRQIQRKKIPKHLAVSRIEPFFVHNMKDAVKISYKHTQKGKVCLLSTASPSFTLFKNYEEKGELFQKYIKKFAKK
jgi:UDP-N-acetylmuramoylalanine--D-glutamate ligase